MGTKREELQSTTGCLAKAAADEPIFVLRAHDELAPSAVRAWADTLYVTVLPPKDMNHVVWRKIVEARELADRMETWQREHGCKVPD